MSGVSFPVSRPLARALVVANPAGRAGLVEQLLRAGLECTECDDPYTAASELAKHRLAFRAMVLSLASLYREELPVVAMVKRRFPHIEIWLAHTDGRHGALADALSFGADGLVDEEGLHRVGAAPASPPAEFQAIPVTQLPSEPLVQSQQSEELIEPALEVGEPVLTADELRALLQDQAPLPQREPEQDS